MKIFPLILYIFLFTNPIIIHAQEHESLDPYGYIKKYDTTFNGIGPKVYILPLPRTLGQEMTDTYKEILQFQDSIQIGFQFERLLSTYKKTTNANLVNQIIHDSENKDFSTIIHHYTEQKNHPIVYSLYNAYALELLSENKNKEAIDILNKALSEAQLTGRAEDIAIIQSNLASAHILSKQFEEALNLEGVYLQHVINTKDLANQAVSHSRIALIQAYMKNYNAAENTIIRRAIPSFNKSKFYIGKIEAWIILAEIYRTQNKHTEAQWFLLQARDLSKEKGLEERLSTIEYMLGSSKLIQANFKIAKQELELAWELAQDIPNKYLQLAIAEQLGRANVHLKDYQAAKDYLGYYWQLRNELF